jgi:phosphoribosylanthranilate isomerase
MLDALGVGWVGLWFRIPRGKHNLDEAELRSALRGFSRSLTGAQPILVTLTAEPDWLWPVLDEHGLSHVQLHGFQLPRDIARLKPSQRGLNLFKTLHVQQGRCLEERFIDAYLDAGVDAFIVDNFGSRDAIGSTGVRYAPAVLERLCTRYPKAQWLCAGGVTSDYLAELKRQLPMLHGVDVDSAARVAGQIDVRAVKNLLQTLETSATRMAA